MKKTSIKHRVIRAGTITMIGSGLSLILSLGVRKVIARVYGPEGMGEYAGFMMFISFFGLIAAFSLPRAVLKFTAEYEEENRPDRVKKLFTTIFIFLTATCILTGLLSLVFTPQLARLIKFQTTPKLTLLLGLTLIFATWSVLSSTLFLGLLQNLRAFIISIISMVVMAGLAAYAYLIRPFPVYILIVGGYLASGLVGLFLATRQGLLGLRFSAEELKKAFRFALPLLLISYLGFFVEWFDRFTLGMYFGVEEMGIYTAGLTVFTAARRLPLSLTEVLVPSYSKISLYGPTVLSRAFNRNLRFYSLGFFLISALLMIYRREAILFLFTEEFLPAAVVILILSGTFVLSVITNPGSSLLVGCGYTGYSSLNYAVGVIVLLSALLLLTPEWGLKGAAVATVLSHLTSTVGMLIILVRVVKIRIEFIPLLKLLGFTGLLIIPAELSRGLVPLAVHLGSFLALYCGGIWFLLLSSADRKEMKEILAKLRAGDSLLKESGVNWEVSEGGGETAGK
jgi:O-antigen/teichoic acid export membrane protein